MNGFMPGEWDWMNRGGMFGTPPFFPTQQPTQTPKPSGGMAGVFDQYGGMGNIGLQLLANSGYSPQKRSFGEILGQSMLGAKQMKDDERARQFREQYLQAQIEAMRRPQPERREPKVIIGPDGKPVYSSDYEGKEPYIQPQSDASRSAFEEEYQNAVKDGYKGDRLQYRRDKARADYIAPQQSGPDSPSGYRWNSKSALEPVPGGPADPNSLSNIRRSNEAATGLRKEFEGMEPVKNYRAAITNYERARTAPNTRAGDLSIVYALGKIFDPASVVREGELQLSKDAQPWLAKIVNEAQSQVTGRGALDPSTRQNMLNAMRGQVDAMQQSYQQEATRYGSYAQSYGLDPSLVTGKDPLEAFSPKNKSGNSRYQEGQTATNPTTGEKMIFKNGQWVKQ